MVYETVRHGDRDMSWSVYAAAFHAFTANRARRDWRRADGALRVGECGGCILCWDIVVWKKNGQAWNDGDWLRMLLLCHYDTDGIHNRRDTGSYTGSMADTADFRWRGCILSAAGKEEIKKKENKPQGKSAQVNISTLCCNFAVSEEKNRGERLTICTNMEMQR